MFIPWEQGVQAGKGGVLSDPSLTDGGVLSRLRDYIKSPEML